jgi:uncharacterized membrane protein
MNKIRSSLVATVAFSLLAMSSAVKAQTKYTVTDFGVDSSVNGINNLGQVVGVRAAGAFIFKNGRVHNLNLPWPGANPICINDNGDIAGHYPDASTAFIYRSTGQAISLNKRLGINALNNRLEMILGVGSTFEALYTGGTLVSLGTTPQGWSIQPQGLNEAGEAVGAVNGPINGPTANDVFDGFLYNNGHFRYFSTFYPDAINNAGQMAGQDLNGFAAEYINGHEILLGTLPGTDGGEAQFINDGGEIIGYCFLDGANAPVPNKPFIYKGGVMRALSVPGWVVTQANGLNNSGQIIATANLGTETHGILLTPR